MDKFLIGVLRIGVLISLIAVILCFTPWLYIAIRLILVGLFLQVVLALVVLVWLLID